MSSQDKQASFVNGYTVPGLDWNSYIALRPTYPDSLFELIYNYHSAHSRSAEPFDALHDAGSGAGIAAEVFACRFKRIHISDPSASYLTAAQARLSQLPNASQFTFQQASAEDMNWLGPKSCDAVTIFSAIHWVDPEQLWPQVARVLRPGGTFVAVFYNGVPNIVNNDKAQETWQFVGKECIQTGLEAGKREEAERKGKGLSRAFPLTVVGLDALKPGTKVGFKEKVTRVKINDDLKVDKTWLGEWRDQFEFPETKVGEQDDLVEYDNWQDWSAQYTIEQLKAMVNTLAHRAGDEVLEPLYNGVKQAMDEQGQERVKVVWSVHVLMASKTAN